MEIYYAKPGPINPIALVGYNVAVWSNPNWNAYRVDFYEPLPRSRPLVFNGGAIPANGAVQNFQLTPALDLSETPPEMVQLRAYVLDDIEVSIKRGTSDVRFKGQNFLAFVDTFTDERDPDGHTTEFVVLKRDHPALDFTNPRAFAIAQSRIALSGYRYILFDLALASKDAKEIERQLGIVTFVAAGGI